MKYIATLAVLLAAFLCAVPRSHAGSPEDNVKVIDQFITSVEANKDLEDAKKKSVVDLAKEMRDDERDQPYAITEGLCEMLPEFRTALETMAEEDMTPAITALSKLAKSEDPFLAAESSYYLAQAYSYAERFEDAVPLLEKLIAKQSDKTVLTGNAQFLLGVSQANMLKRKDAIKTLNRFIDENPNSSEAMRIAAWQQVERLKLLEEGTLSDVFERMDYSRRRLKLAESGTDTQHQQQEIIAMLGKLIKEAEDRECNCSGSGSGENQKDGQGEGEGEGEQQAGKGTKGGQSKNQNDRVVKRYDLGPQSPWSKLRDRKRDPAFSAIKEKYPARYQKLIEQYYQSFNNEGGE